MTKGLRLHAPILLTSALGPCLIRPSLLRPTEYFPNGDLQKYLSSSLIEKEARHIILQVLEGLQLMHDNGFVHRGLKLAVSSKTRTHAAL